EEYDVAAAGELLRARRALVGRALIERDDDQRVGIGGLDQRHLALEERVELGDAVLLGLAVVVAVLALVRQHQIELRLLAALPGGVELAHVVWAGAAGREILADALGARRLRPHPGRAFDV